jgi:hypothetical protein
MSLAARRLSRLSPPTCQCLRRSSFSRQAGEPRTATSISASTRLGVEPTRPVVRKAFAIVCSLRWVALPSPPCDSPRDVPAQRV